MSPSTAVTHRPDVAATVGAATSPPGEPQTPAVSGRTYRAARLLADPIAKLLWPTTVDGREHLAPQGPAIIAANHLSFFDSVALAVAARRRIGFVGKAEYLDDWKTRRLFPALGMIALERGRRPQALRALAAAARVIESGQLFAIFPEGTR